MITLGETKPGDIVRLHPGHVREYRGDSAPWYYNHPMTFIILSKDKVGHGDVKDEICCWPMHKLNDHDDSCMGNPALRFVERNDVLCELLGNLAYFVPRWPDDFTLPFNARRELDQ